MICLKMNRDILELFEISWVSRDKRNWFGESGTSINPEIMKMMVLGFSHKQIEKLLILNEAD